MAETFDYAAELQAFIGDFAPRAVFERKEEFALRGGGHSNRYVDTREGLAQGPLMARAARLMLARADQLGLDFTHVAGNGVGGRMFVSPLLLVGHGMGKVLRGVWVNDDASDEDLLNGYGCHGASVAGERVLPVDDIAMTGNSTVTLVGMLRNEGAIVDSALYLTDRGHGQAAHALGELGVATHALLTFNEQSGTFEVIP